MDLSVVIPARNAARTLGQQIDALQNQGWSGRYEIIVADNGSVDDTASIVRAAATNRPEIPLVLADASSTPGAGHARNQGVARARSRFLAFCDADDVVTEGWTAAMYGALERHPFVCGASRFSRINPGWAISAYPYLTCEIDPTLPPSPWLPLAGGSNLGVRKELFDRLGGFDERLGAHEDTDLSWRSALRGEPVVLAANALIDYRLRSSVAKIFRQAQHYGLWFVPIVRRFHPLGLPNILPSRSRLLKELAFIYARFPGALSSRAKMGRWAFEAGWRHGLLIGHARRSFAGVMGHVSHARTFVTWASTSIGICQFL